MKWVNRFSEKRFARPPCAALYSACWLFPPLDLLLRCPALASGFVVVRLIYIRETCQCRRFSVP